MVRLSKRLRAIADQVIVGKDAADIGSDHALIPIYLLERGLAPRVILTDRREGPLEKARRNLTAAGIDMDPADIRRGDGLQVLENAEVATVLIAGMGGLLIAEILSADIAKAHSFERFVLQPRTAAPELRRWLTENSFLITNECLAPEGQRLCEVITAEPGRGRPRQDREWSELDYEISPLFLEVQEPCLQRFVDEKIRESERILRNLAQSRDPDAPGQIVQMQDRIRELAERKARL